MSPSVDAGPGESRSFPRVSGDEPRPAQVARITFMFSPRERG